jgi:hypothetical protein
MLVSHKKHSLSSPKVCGIRRRAMCLWVVVFCLGVVSPHLGLAQVNMRDLDFEVYHQVDGSLFLSHRDTLFQVDVEKGVAVPFAEMPKKSSFGPNNYPVAGSSVISDSVMWMWDRSVGSTVFVRPDGSQEYFASQYSGSRFSHAATTRPDTGEPLVFGGYGQFRAKDFFIYFDVELREWRELPHKKGKNDPKPQTQSNILDIGNGKDVYLIQGFISGEELPPVYDKLPSRIALVFDIVERVWKETPMNEEVACLITTLAKNRHFNFRGGGLAYGGYLYHRYNPCHAHYQIPTAISEPVFVFWRPGSGEWAHYSADFNIPTDHYPIGLIFDDDKLSVITVRRIGRDGFKIVTLERKIPDDLSWNALPRSVEEMQWLATAIIISVLSSALCIIYFLLGRNKIMLSEKDSMITMRRGMVTKDVKIPQNSTILLIALLRLKPGEWAKRPSFEMAFSEFRYDPDTLRSISNRAMNNINELARKELNMDIVQRQSAEEDRRVNEYRIIPKVHKWISIKD